MDPMRIHAVRAHVVTAAAFVALLAPAALGSSGAIAAGDSPRRTEVTDLDDALRLLDFARAKGMSTISMWAIQRD
jgi:hypothetical protein